jgi:regulatory protein
LDAALRLLAVRQRSRQEIADRLKQRKLNPEVVTATLTRLDELGLLDDIKFAQALARDRLELTRKGKRQIALDLHRKGISRSIVAQTLSELGSEEQSARALLHKAAPRYAGLEPRVRYRKLHDLLARRGFLFATIERVLSREERQAADAEETSGGC